MVSGRIGLYKIFLYFDSFVHESIVLSFLPPICIGHTVAILLRASWAVYDPSSTSLLYALHHTILVKTISCEAYMLNMRREAIQYGILFLFSPFHEYSNLEYEHVPVQYRVHQAEHVIHICAAASQEYVKDQQVTHTHTPTENNTPDTDTHAHDKNNAPNPQTNTSHKHSTQTPKRTPPTNT